MMLLLFLFSLSALHVLSVNATIIRCYQGSFNNYVDINIDNDVNDPTTFLTTECYNSSKNTVFIAPDIYNPMTHITVKLMVDTYSADRNVMVVGDPDSNMLTDNFLLSGIKVNMAGKRFAKALKSLFNAGVSLSKSLFVGFAVGAHVIGVAGREIKKTGLSLDRIIGLDPAKEFYESNPLAPKGLDSTCGSFVLILHTNEGGLGTNKDVGHVDVRANCGNMVQPGCEKDDGLTLGSRTASNICSQERSVLYLVDSHNIPNSYVARPALSCDAWKIQAENRTLVLGSPLDTSLLGKFFYYTNSRPPYGRGEAGSHGNA